MALNLMSPTTSNLLVGSKVPKPNLPSLSFIIKLAPSGFPSAPPTLKVSVTVNIPTCNSSNSLSKFTAPLNVLMPLKRALPSTLRSPNSLPSPSKS